MSNAMKAARQQRNERDQARIRATSNGISVSCKGPNLQEKRMDLLIEELGKYKDLPPEDPKRPMQRGVVRGLALAVQMDRKWFGNERIPVKDIEAEAAHQLKQALLAPSSDHEA